MRLPRASVERLVSVEGARGLGLPLCRKLLAEGETVIDVPSAFTAPERRSNRRPDKDDQGDAVAVARVALREPGFQGSHRRCWLWT